MTETITWISVAGAALGYILGTTGIVSQIIAWRRVKAAEDSKADIAKIAGDVEIAKVAGSVVAAERELTGRFQTQLLDRLDTLERARAGDGARISELEERNSGLLSKIEEIATLHGKLLGEHSQLKHDHEQLKRHVAKLETDNRAMRAKLSLVR